MEKTVQMCCSITFEPEAPQWCLFMDPDEFVSRPAALASAFGGVPDDRLVVNVPRFNVSGVRPNCLEYRSHAFADLDLKILWSQRSAEDRRSPRLNPPWIFTDIPGKVGVRVSSEVTIGDGDHSATGSTGWTLYGQELLHFPIRSWEKFREKISLAKLDLESNPQLGPDFAWHWRRVGSP